MPGVNGTHLTAALNPNVIMYAIASVLELQKKSKFADRLS
jgi:hypothetical protein